MPCCANLSFNPPYLLTLVKEEYNVYFSSLWIQSQYWCVLNNTPHVSPSETKKNNISAGYISMKWYVFLAITRYITFNESLEFLYLVKQTKQMVFRRAPRTRLYHLLFWASSPKRFLTIPSLSLTLRPSINENSLTSKNSSWNI